MNTQTDMEKVIEKVRKLLALAESSNEHEAALAASRAQEILARHNLTMAQVDSAPGETDPIIKDDSDITIAMQTAWTRMVRGGAATLYFCKYYYQPHHRSAPHRKCGYQIFDHHTYIGTRPNVEVAKLMSNYLISTVDRLAKEGSKNFPQRERSRYINSFRNSCSNKLRYLIDERIKESMAEETVSQTNGSSRNLPALAPLYNQEKNRVAKYMEDAGISLGKGRQRTSSHGQGMLDGRASASGISLNTQVGGGSSGRRRIR